MSQAPSLSLRDVANDIANHPDVLPAVAKGFDAVDLRPFFLNPLNFAVGHPSVGMAMFAPLGDGRFEGHYLFRPGADRRHVLDICRGALTIAFTRYGASAIVGHVPADNVRARTITRALGFTRQGTSVSASGRSCVDYVLERAQWAI